MGCDLSNTLNQNTQQPRYPMVVQPQDGANHYNQNQYQYAQPQYAYNQPQYQPVPNQYQYQKQMAPQSASNSQPMVQPQKTDNKQNVSSIVPVKPVLPKSEQDGKPKVQNKRGVMPLHANHDQSFLIHHLKYQMHLSKYASASLIKKRQILQSQLLQGLIGKNYNKNGRNLNQFASKSHYQRTVLQIFEAADKEFFQQNKSYDEVRQKIAQRFLFELFQNKQFTDAGFGRLIAAMPTSQLPTSYTVLQSDSAIFPILRFLKQKYPQVADKSTIKFPQVKERKQDVDLLDNFPSKCYSSPGLFNIQTLFSDLKFLIDRSVEEFADFQNDMKFLLGEDVLTDSKVKKVTKNGAEEYSASPVRRVFIKWAQTIIQRIPDIMVSQAFLQFVRCKSYIADNFYFKSTVQPTTHVMAIKFLCQLLEAAKYDITNLIRKKEFGFFIYDLLRCKTKRKTGEQVCELLKKMEETKVTPSGKKFQVVRIKDRFKTPNRDLMVNFRYGDVIVGEAQLCIDTSDVSDKIKKTNKFNHYIYELERGLFGPTCELIMQYEDFERKDISANLQAQGMVHKRVSKKPLDYIKKVNMKCFNGHDLIQLKGNHFIKNENGGYDDMDYICDYCEGKVPTTQKYYYCYFCTLVFCKGCQGEYKKVNIKQIQNRCNRQDLLIELKNQQEITSVMNKSPIIMFYLNKGEASTILKDFIVYYLAINKLQKKQLPLIYSVCCDGDSKNNIVNTYKIKEFPTTIVFSNDGTAQSTLIGASYEMMQGLIQVQKKLQNGQSKGLQINCFCGQPMQQAPLQENDQINCVQCANKSKTEGYMIGLQSHHKAYVCQNQHVKCINCGFLADNQPSKFKDFRAKTFKTDFRYDPKLPKCSQGHQTVYVKQIDVTRELQCFRCKKNFLFNSVLGAANCSKCQKYCCHNCLGINDNYLKQTECELVTHKVQATAQQGQKCICGQSFKKVYNTRKYREIAEQQEKMEQKQKLQLIRQCIFQDTPKKWSCIVCNQQKDDGQLHLVCFRCPYFSHRNAIINVEFCMKCAIISDLLNRQLKNKFTQVPTEYTCKSNHPVVLTKLAYNNEDMTFDCKGCRKTYYIYSQRYYCKTCRTNVCVNCECDHLINKNPPQCKRKCQKGCKLKLTGKPNILTMCDACKVTIRKSYFTCTNDCDSSLCLQCAATSPSIDTRARRMRSIDHQLVNKKLQAYENGLWDEYNIEDNLNELADNINEAADNINQFSNNLDQLAKGLDNALSFFD